MIIDSLSVLDFRVFSGVHNFDLIPKLKRGKQAPIVLFGGLNGGGKTTILTALKLALYGKGVLGTTATLSDYHQYLKDCIHRAHNSIAKPTRAAVELSFRYAQHGIISTYHLARDWVVESSGKVKEGLVISKDGQPLTELSYDQAQSFLNELIPIGVSELFFFDGEKIASLAEETTGDALRDSINKLLGLDLIDRLDSDLSVLIRTRAAKRATAERKKLISDAEASYARLKSELGGLKEQLLQIRVEISETEHNLVNVDSRINSRGGAWSASKQKESARLESLIVRKQAIELTLHALLSGLLPFSLTKVANKRLLSQLASEKESVKAQLLASYIQQQQEKFIAVMESSVPEMAEFRGSLLNAYTSTFSEVLGPQHEQKPQIHGLSDSRFAAIEHRLTHALRSEHDQAGVLVKELEGIDSEIDAIGENIARAPDDDVIMPLFKEQGLFQERLRGLQNSKSVLVEAVKERLGQLALAARRLDDLHSDTIKSQEVERVFSLAEQARSVLKEFSVRAREAKLKELESQFYLSFNKLARKEDRHLSIKINPVSFEVDLFDESGQLIKKGELSAGEKQIFAISILEALARTSGRSLPVVIDTPLGRLDSLHRKKLLDNYFPRTSHQVIILSTDTEIDFSFYERLTPHISHSYHLAYDPESRSTQVEDGYFWRNSEEI